MDRRHYPRACTPPIDDINIVRFIEIPWAKSSLFSMMNSDENKFTKLEVMAYTDYIVTSAVDIF